MADALAGVRVLDFSQVVFGPTCSQILGDFGADVIKVEPLTGELGREGKGGSLAFGGGPPPWVSRNRNKRSIAVDLKHPEGKQVVLDLLPTANVVLENFRPGVMERLGLGYEALKPLNPKVIYASGSGYGPTGPYRLKGGQDRAATAYAGVTGIQRNLDGVPIPVAASVGDIMGGMFLAHGILAALLHAERTGEGQKLHVSILDGQLALIAPEAAIYLNTGETNVRPFRPLHWVYKTLDGYLQTIEYWHPNPLQRFCAALEIDDLSRDSRFDSTQNILAHGRELHELLAPHFAMKTTATWLERLEAQGLMCAPVNDMPAVFSDPQVIHNQMVVEMEHPAYGKVKAVANPVKLEGTPARVRSGPPLLGEHTDEVLTAIGYSPEKIKALRAHGAIGGMVAGAAGRQNHG